MNVRRSARTAVVAVAAAALAIPVVQASSASGENQPLYTNASTPAEQRSDDLLHRMTLEEKVGQMTQIKVGQLRGNCDDSKDGPLNDQCMQDVLINKGTGSILSGGGDAANPNTPRAWAEMTNGIQRYALDHSRLKIPVLYGADGVHGHNNVISATLFPQQIGLGSSWDPALLEKVGGSVSRAMRATGVFWDFAPVSDLSRDTRWGRYYETYSEDPYLAGSMAASEVRGMQAKDGEGAQLTATAKHFAGYSQPANGHDRIPAQLPLRYLQDTFLPSFQAQFDAGVKTVMIDSGAINGIPVHSSHYMLTEQLRNRMHFQGVAISDWEDVRYLVEKYHVAADYPAAIAMAVNAGMDMAMEAHDAGAFTSGLLQDVRSGKVGQQRIDEAVRRILTLKFSLGLFEHPYVDPAKADQIVNGADRDLARRSAVEAGVLLRNQNNALPLSKGAHKLVVTGDTANNPARQLGGWTVGWQGVPDGTQPPPTVTPLQGIREAVPGANVVDAPDQATAVAQAKDADAVVVALGEKPGAEGPNDNENPAFTPEQQSLVTALKATGKPVIAVLLTGRPLALGSVAQADALLADWQNGTEGGHAVADLLFGDANPSGKLPVSWPKTTGDEPMSYDQLPGPSAGDSASYDPAYPFGAGLSYTSFATGKPTAPAGVDRSGKVSVNFSVRNTGQRAGTAVVPVYVHQPVSQVLVPDKRLVGYARVDLRPGQEQKTTVSFDIGQLAVTSGDVDGDGRREVEPGVYQFVVGDAAVSTTVR